MAFRFALALAVALSMAPVLDAQMKPAASCKWLTLDEAATVLGPATKLQRAVEDGFCTFERGPLTLQIAQPARVGDAKALEAVFNAAKKGANGTDEPGIGSRAFLSQNARRIGFTKGDAFVLVDIMGEGAGTPAMQPAFKDAVKKIAGRF